MITTDEHLKKFITSVSYILGIGSKDGDLSGIINKTNSGILCNYNEIDILKSSTLEMYNHKLVFKTIASANSILNINKNLSNLLNKLLDTKR